MQSLYIPVMQGCSLDSSPPPTPPSPHPHLPKSKFIPLKDIHNPTFTFNFYKSFTYMWPMQAPPFLFHWQDFDDRNLFYFLISEIFEQWCFLVCICLAFFFAHANVNKLCTAIIHWWYNANIKWGWESSTRSPTSPFFCPIFFHGRHFASKRFWFHEFLFVEIWSVTKHPDSSSTFQS